MFSQVQGQFISWLVIYPLSVCLCDLLQLLTKGRCDKLDNRLV